MEKDLSIAVLLDFYGDLLTEKQVRAIDLYYNEDLSLAEISELLGITRQGVRDNIKRAENTMNDTEERLGLVSKFLGISEKLAKIDDIIREIEKSPNVRYLSDDIKHKINDILMIIGSINDDEQ